jgi:hypothetical protein
VSDKIREIDDAELRTQLMYPACHPMAVNYDDDLSDDSDDND